MKNWASLIIFTSLTLALTGCSKHSPATNANQNDWELGVVEVSDGVQIQRDLGSGRICTIMPAIQKNGSVLMALKIFQGGKLLLSPRIQAGSDQPAVMTIGDITIGVTPHIKPSIDDKDTVFPGRHMSEHQVADLALSQLPKSLDFRCVFSDGVWEIQEVKQGVWGESSRTTNADGKITVESTNATRVVLRVSDADGRVESVKTP